RAKAPATMPPKLRITLPALRRAICIHAGGFVTRSSPFTKSCLVSSRRNFPLEVLGMLPSGSNSTRSGGSPNPCDTCSVTAAAIAGVNPREFVFTVHGSGGKQLRRRGRIFVVAGSCRWSAKPQKSLRAIGNLVSFFVDDAHFVARKSATRRNERNNRNRRGLVRW